MNIAIFTPSRNQYSETFIQAHKTYLKEKVFYYYGINDKTQLEGQSHLMPITKYRLLRLYGIFLRKKSNFLWQQMLLYSLKANKIDNVLVEYGTHAYRLLDLLKKIDLPVTVHFHGYDASEYKVIKACNNYQDVFKIAKKIIVVSKVMKRALLDIGCPNEKIVYNVYGPDQTFINILPVFKKKQFLSVGRFTNKKAPYYTIMAFQKVLSMYPNAKLLMAGDGALLNMCKNLVKQLQLEKNVLFIGVINAKEYIDLLTESLAYVQHSVRAENGDMEGTPLSILEASAAGLPVISTYHAGIPDVIEHNKTGLLCKEHDLEAMSVNMLRVLNDLDFAKKLGQAGKLNIRENFSLDKHINNLQNVLNNII